MKKTVFYIGTNDKDCVFARKFDDEYFTSRIVGLLGDCTIQECIGHYTMTAAGLNTQIDEKTFIVTYIHNKTEKEIKNACKYFKTIFNQESILIETSKFNGQFI